MNWKRRWLRGAVVIGVIYLGWLLRAITAPLMLAYLIALVLLPLRNTLEPKLGRSGACLGTLILAALLPVTLLIPVITDVQELQELFPEPIAIEDGQAAPPENISQESSGLAQLITEQLTDLQERFPNLKEINPEDLQQYTDRAVGMLLGAIGILSSFLGGFIGILSGLILVPIFVYFLLQQAPWLPHIRKELPADWHPRFDKVMPKIVEILRAYTTSRFLVATGKGLVYFLLLWLVNLFHKKGIPAFYTLSLMAGGLSLLPILGPAIAFLILALVAFASMGFLGLLLSFGIYALAELIEGYVLLPKLVGRGLGMSDFAVILAVMSGGALLGIFGFLVAIPAVAVGKVLYDEYLRPVMGTELTGT